MDKYKLEYYDTMICDIIDYLLEEDADLQEEDIFHYFDAVASDYFQRKENAEKINTHKNDTAELIAKYCLMKFNINVNPKERYIQNWVDDIYTYIDSQITLLLDNMSIDDTDFSEDISIADKCL